ncbi:MAG: helix-turn-helix transcriptional regulator [Candidatus Ratteibacteria bacterium]|jgi:transcriptional regulator with XRE-family HTH domain
MDEILATFGKRVKQLRNLKGLSQMKLAEKAKMHYTSLGAIERSEKNATLKNISRLAKALEVEIADLFKSNIGVSRKMELDDIVILLKDKSSKDLRLAKRTIKAMFEK